jgi:glycosyltransferase involved in cell wall biosynthesis
VDILVFYQYFGTPKGRWSTRMYELTRRWVKAGHRVTVITSPYEKSDIVSTRFIEKQSIDGINLIVINSGDSNRFGALKRIYRAILFSIVSCYYGLKIPCDIVISSSGPITIGLPGLMAKWFKKKPFVFEVRDLWPDGAIELGKLNNRFFQKIGLWFEKLCYKNASLVIPCSKGMNEGVLRKVPEAKTLIIPNASDIDLFKRGREVNNNDEFSNKKILIYAGSLGLMDEVEQAIYAMQFVQDPEIQLLIIGEGAEKVHLQNIVQSLNLKSVHFLGIMPKNDVIKWFHRAFASIVTFKDLPVLHTSSPNKMFDSFAAGLPIIQSTKGWIKELVDEYNCGINVDPNNPKSFGEAINLLANNISLQKEKSHNAYHLACTKFNRDQLAKDYLDGILKLKN